MTSILASVRVQSVQWASAAASDESMSNVSVAQEALRRLLAEPDPRTSQVGDLGENGRRR